MITARAVTFDSNGNILWQDDGPGSFSVSVITAGRYAVTFPEKYLSANHVAIVGTGRQLYTSTVSNLLYVALNSVTSKGCTAELYWSTASVANSEPMTLTIIGEVAPVPTFDPQSLFANGENGFYWENRLGGWFKDAAGNTPVDGNSACQRINNLKTGATDYIHLGTNNSWQARGYGTNTAGFWYNSTTPVGTQCLVPATEQLGGNGVVSIWMTTYNASNNYTTTRMGPGIGSGAVNALTLESTQTMSVFANSTKYTSNLPVANPTGSVFSRCVIFRQGAEGTRFVNNAPVSTPTFPASTNLTGTLHWSGGGFQHSCGMLIAINRELTAQEQADLQYYMDFYYG